MIEEVKPTEGFERIGSHSHIKGLGLDESGKAVWAKDGMIGQAKAREAAGIVVKLIKMGKFAGKGVLLAGPVGSGKTAIAMGIAKELGEGVPFVQISGSEIYSVELKKTEFLKQCLRKAIGVKFREKKQVYEGAVEKFDLKMRKHPFNPYVEVPESATVTLATKDERKTLRLDSRVATRFLSENIQEGDVIEIDAETGRVMRLGTSKTEADVYAERIVDIPKGPVFKTKTVTYTVTLNDLDVVNSRSSILLGFFTTFAEISDDIRQSVDEKVKEWVNEGRAELIPGVLFIDECHMLDIESFSFLARAMEQELAPILILATNRGRTKIRGTDIVSPHGIPLDMLDRLLIINTQPYTRDEIREIIKVRAKEEKIELDPGALEKLADIGVKTSLRYAVQLLAPAKVMAGNSKVTTEHIDRVNALFADLNSSVNYIEGLRGMLE